MLDKSCGLVYNMNIPANHIQKGGQNYGKCSRNSECGKGICTVNGDDIPMDMIILVRAEREIVSLLSPMPFKAPEDKRVEAAIAVSVANYGMIDGSFDYDINDGEIRFRMTASFIDSQLGEEQFKYMLFVSAQTIDRYNDRFMALVKGTMTLQQFVDLDKE